MTASRHGPIVTTRKIDLRDRLAMAIKKRWHEMTFEEDLDEGSFILADAVIEELGLEIR